MMAEKTPGGRAANQWVLPHRCPLNIVKKLTIFEVSSRGQAQDNRQIIWENINVQLAFKAENRPAIGDPAPMMNLLRFWGDSMANLRSA